MISQDYQRRLLFCLLTFFLLGAVLFIIGFFPISYDRTSGGQSEFGSRPIQLDDYRLDPPPQIYSENMLMLVDALREDFVTAERMPFAYNASCEHLRLRVDIPTVTMPRLKSITTGTLSNFIDIVLNLGNTEQLDDSILHRLKRRGDAIVFAGDRTWVNLFPSEFRRKEETIDSFFVQEFYEGDKNVTRTLKKELTQNDWSLMILHYLGLDHIGHVEGTASLKISPKLKEMDDVVKDIYQYKHLRHQMLLLTGDHGMRNGGGHGGSTMEELYVPLLFFKTNCTTLSKKPTEYNQIDLAPTLSILLSIEIPRASIGCLIPELLQGLTFEQQLYAYHYNTEHLLYKAAVRTGKANVQKSDYYKWFLEAKESYKQFLKAKRNDNVISSFSFENAKLNYIRASREISNSLSETLVRFDYDLIVTGLLLTTLSTIYAIFVVFFAESKLAVVQQYTNAKQRFIILFILAIIINACCHYLHYIETSNNFQSLLFILPISICLHMATDIFKILFKFLLPLRQYGLTITLAIPLPLLACFIFHTLSLASSSFIEQEHETWYYLGTSLIIASCARVFCTKLYSVLDGNNIVSVAKILTTLWLMRWSVILIIITALVRRYAHFEVLTRDENKYWLSLVFALGLLSLLIQILKFNTPTQKLACTTAVLAIYCFRSTSGAVNFPLSIALNTTFVLLLFWLSLVVIIAIAFKSVILCEDEVEDNDPKTYLKDLLQTKITCLLLIAALLHKPYNVILVAATLFTLDQVYKLCDNFKTRWRYAQSYVLVHKVVLTIFVAKMFYFCQGNSNSLATIDLNPGYIGQSKYNPLIVAIFVTLNTYSAPISSFFYLILNTLNASTETNSTVYEKKDHSMQAVFQASAATAIKDLQIVISFYTLTSMLPVAVYLCLMVIFRYHLFIYSVFAPKAFYECFGIIVFYLNFCVTNSYLMFMLK